ncbi:hypothetical protein JDS99_28420 [Bacillus cereus group sp. N6]|uniref:hypothetical protein n=1 Tax=Bacillus cereus group sp. N6 TaxID=2794583 RepID=UPI0018F51894|nr:hypothetical protein [Bacillus cereus group sp. N6]MBJ8113478.1 hypothetical protein [Bacillus cereus group sp. N6]
MMNKNNNMKKFNIKKLVIGGMLAGSLAFSGYMIHMNDKLTNECNELIDEVDQLKQTEGGTSATKWDKTAINEVLDRAEKIVNDTKRNGFNELQTAVTLMELKEEFNNVKDLQLPREYENYIFRVYSTTDLMYTVFNDSYMDDETKNITIELVEKSIKNAKEVADKYEE